MNKLPIHINNLQFSKQKQTLSGQLDAMAFTRLAGSLVNMNAPEKSSEILSGNTVDYVLAGWVDVQNRPFLKLTIDAKLHMHCQRCLSPMPVQLNLNFTYLLTDQSEEEIMAGEEMDDEVDLITLDPQMELGVMMEDELLMALPIAPVHADACGQLDMSSGEKMNPFAALKSLKKR